jgi:hypothetical protein
MKHNKEHTNTNNLFYYTFHLPSFAYGKPQTQNTNYCCSDYPVYRTCDFHQYFVQYYPLWEGVGGSPDVGFGGSKKIQSKGAFLDGISRGVVRLVPVVMA